MRMDLKIKIFLTSFIQFIIILVELSIFTNDRIWCCTDSWNIDGDGEDNLEFEGCFCYHDGDIGDCTEYIVTSSKLPTTLRGGRGIIFDFGL